MIGDGVKVGGLRSPKGQTGATKPGSVADSCHPALEPRQKGSQAFIIAGADAVMNHPSAELLAEVFPDLPLTRDVSEFDTLLANDRAAAGFEPTH
ncbi:MAG TPA: hypothetical protein VHX12_13990 [Acidisoma sp.]|jgi:hypothetical protein|nr:hypothetical protein [Acidisoma sp.]